MTEDFTVEIQRYPTDEDWLRCKDFALNTVGKKAVNMPNDEWKYKILKCGHSPIRTLMFTIKVTMPYCNSVHFVRHKYGIEHYVTSQRNDRQSNYDRDSARQDSMVTHIMDVDAAELIYMSHKRLCMQADKRTREIMQAICKEVIKTNPEFKPFLVPECEHLYGHCNEMFPCGKYKDGE